MANADQNNVVKRSSKNRPLTFAEGDQNLDELINVIDDNQALDDDVNGVGGVDERLTDVEQTRVRYDELNSTTAGEGASLVSLESGDTVEDAIVIKKNSVADMIATDLKVGETVRTLGYYSAGDGGGNDYEIVAGGTGTSDGGSFIDLANGLQAKGLFPAGKDVLQFGAGSGSGDLAKFQAAIDSTPDGEVVVLRVGSGDYVDDLATLAVGTRSLVWIEGGDVSYATSAPPGARERAAYLGDKARPWIVGEVGSGKNVTDGTISDRPNLRVQRNADHTGGTTGGSVESSALSVATFVGSGVANYETALLSVLENQGGSSGQNLVGFHAEGRKKANGGGITFGNNIAAKDLSGNSSTVSGGALIGQETTMSASGPDDADTRIALDTVLKKESAAASASYYAGLRIRPSSAAGRESTIKNAIVVDHGTAGGNVTRGLLLKGRFANGVIDSEAVGNPSLLRIGSDNSAATESLMKIEATGLDSVGAKEPKCKPSH